MAKGVTPFLWSLFGAGGAVSALLFPIHIFLLGLAFPLNWLDGPNYDLLHGLVTHPITRLYVFVFISLPLFHWAHRFRYLIYDLFQVKHGTELIAVACYGTALAGTVTTAYTLWTLY